MFYSQFILSKKGPLGTIWIAAHLERKLRKNQVNETDIASSVDSIMFPEVPIALRLSGHLLLGVVRIYSRKVTYLFHDCNEALTKLKSAFNVAAVDLPPESARAALHSITLPEAVLDLDMDFLADKENQNENVPRETPPSSVDKHVTDRDQITLQEPVIDDAYPGAHFEAEERFTPSLFRDLDQRREFGDSLEPDVLPPMPEVAMPPDTPMTSNLPDDIQVAPDSAVSDIETLRSAPVVPEDDFMDFGKELPEEHANVPPPPPVPQSPDVHLPEEIPLQTPGAGPSISLADVSENNELLGRPLDVVETPVAKRRKLNQKRKKRTYDEAVQLDKDYYQQALQDPSDLVRPREKIGHTSRLGKNIFEEPVMLGLCSQLKDLYAGAKRLKVGPKTPRADKPSTSHVSEEIPEVPRTPEAPKSPEGREVPEVHETPKSADADQGHARTPEVQEPAEVEEGPSPAFALPETEEPETAVRSPMATPQQEHRAPEDTFIQGDQTEQTPAPLGTPSTGVSTRDELRSKFSHERLSERLNAAAEETMVYEGAIDSAVLLESNESPSSQESGEENHGWSGRTRAIAQFLRATFEAMPSDSEVSLDRVLGGKSRREAARMFFETLVLRTNDYIQAQQNDPYEDISIYAQPKLMKAVF